MRIENGTVRYNVGDRVVVTRNELHEQHYGTGGGSHTLFWNSTMNQYCGRVVTIRRVLDNCKYRIDEDEGYWIWCNTFFEGLASSVSLQDSLNEDEDLEPCSFGNYFKEYRVI